MSNKILIINGPNLNMLGMREADIYGSDTLSDIEDACRDLALSYGLKTDFFQSNHEGEIIDYLQKSCDEDVTAIIINPAAYTHTSVAIRDALLLHTCPIIEVHLSNIYKREDFRRTSMISDIAYGVLSGFGGQGYLMAIEAIAALENG